MVKITKRSVFSGKLNTIEIPMTDDEFDNAMEAWENGMFIQDAFHKLSATQREFILSGVTEDEWNVAFPDEDDEYMIGSDALAYI